MPSDHTTSGVNGPGAPLGEEGGGEQVRRGHWGLQEKQCCMTRAPPGEDLGRSEFRDRSCLLFFAFLFFVPPLYPAWLALVICTSALVAVTVP
ncbi:uncharacterized protein BO72DRAFT_118996 [Aspergillus fijiensis CBS 313.89]|uniref:Uncharacterized protein n=1 Tax=Aspergillus fijiensis CBS 313.89 TaxID=1448319 RepID=A0A8G1RRL4_9EURO|nr:uncharacterized protein BO72DRAFT_118996 [Aspergillus fijiensis CBS 313.89]RAK77018.1 hypothetical protein BO72DRAFT_118996 [Aspergillus fijiensis CBS 313.89]